MAQDYVVRRRYARIASQNPILVRKLGDCEPDGFARTQVMGLGGCMFVSAISWGVGTFVEMLLSVRGKLAKLQARIVYEQPREDLTFEIGVEFVEIPSLDRNVIENLFLPREGTA
ncbi:MAG: PilZ domain-containing protein [Deltaproteobacteria bacterium]|nr:PilZ domain-containing protein [Deltaproteobacteria bacterium]